MRYQGSKAKLSKTINDLVQKNIKINDVYIEPFCGGCNSFSYIKHNSKIAIDSNEYIIAIWDAIKNKKWTPYWCEFIKNLTKEEYYRVKQMPEKYPDFVVGYVATACSYGGGWWSGYANYNPNKNENHILEAYNGLMKQISTFENLNGSKFICGNYNDFEYGKNCFIYCDPPYESTKKYKNPFDHKQFWDWCRGIALNGIKIMISEYNAPDDFVEIWSKTMQDGMSAVNTKRKVEKIFVHKSQIKNFKI